MIQYSTLTNVNGAFPNYTGKNASGAGATDGTPFIGAFVDDLWGRFQDMMDYAGLTPDGVTEATGTSQHMEALKKGFALGAGYTVMYNKSGTPVANGDRVLLLTGQGVLRSSYTELDAATYVGDGANIGVGSMGGAFYRADDAAGTSPNVNGIYLILPDYRGRVPRGEDIGSTVDPDGAGRFLGDHQADAMQRITGTFSFDIAAKGGTGAFGQGSTTTSNTTTGVNNDLFNFDNQNSTSPNQAKTDDDETRMANVMARFAITY